jgi:hypothetical protein
VLLNFLADLNRDEKLKRAFSKNPVGTIQKAGLSQEQQAALQSRNPHRIAALVARELSQSQPVGWPAPSVKIIPPVQPTSGFPGQILSPFTINGQYFASDAKADIESGGTVVFVSDVTVTNSDPEHCTLTGTLVLPVDLQPGGYTVRVANSDTPDDQNTLPNGFQVKALPPSKAPAKKAPAKKAPASKAPAKKAPASKAPAKKAPAKKAPAKKARKS